VRRPALRSLGKGALLIAAGLVVSAGRLTTTESKPKIIEGMATVIDGDGIEIAGRKIRLFGIDAPEVEQYCSRKDGSRWRCGQYATVALDRMAGGKIVECAVRDIDVYDRAVAICRTDGRDLSAEQVTAGWAMAYRRYSSDYVKGEETAHGAGLGIWIGPFDPPWQWRTRRR
jgi:endonuclease YncB( thermonuclease family)